MEHSKKISQALENLRVAVSDHQIAVSNEIRAAQKLEQTKSSIETTLINGGARYREHQ